MAEPGRLCSPIGSGGVARPQPLWLAKELKTHCMKLCYSGYLHAEIGANGEWWTHSFISPQPPSHSARQFSWLLKRCVNRLIIV